MSTGNFEFQYAEVENCMNKIEDESKKMKSILDKCNNYLNDSIGDKKIWSGDSSNSVKEKWNRLSDNFNQYYQMMIQKVEKIRKVSAEHKQFEQNNS